jgi:asparaginyl-tRNA synthetase
MTGVIETGLGTFSKEKFNALLNVRSTALGAIRYALIMDGHTEVSTSSLVNIAGSCENPYASFNLNYYGREAHLSQSAQLQLEALVIRLKRGVFTVNNSFREENYDDPEANGRRLSEFTLIEPEKPYEGLSAEEALTAIIACQERILKSAIKEVLQSCEEDLHLLGGKVDYLKSVLNTSFNRLTYDDAIALLNRSGGSYKFGDDLNIMEERKILQHFDDIPTFVTHYPTAIKFFNMKRMPDNLEKVYSVDLLMPRLGETTGGAVREENGELIKDYLLSSKIATYIREQGGDPLEPFQEYFNLFEQEQPTIRGGFGIGFERFVGFLLNSNDILDTIAYRAMQPF